MNLDNEELKVTKNRQAMELSKEEQEAIEKLEQMQKFYNEFLNSGVEISTTLNQKDIRTIIQILNLISKIQKEYEKQSKVIDEMAEKIYKLKVKLELNNLSEDCFIPREFSDINDCIKRDCKECIKQYFYRKVENENENND